MKLHQFSLRAALVAFTLVGVGLGFYGRHLAEQRRRSESLAKARHACEAAKSFIGFKQTQPGEYTIIVHGPSFTPAALSAVADASIITRVVAVDPLPQATETELGKQFPDRLSKDMWQRQDEKRP